MQSDVITIDDAHRSNEISIVKIFQYRGVEVFIRKISYIYEYVFPFKGRVYGYHYKMISSRKKRENEDLEKEIISRLASTATLSIDELIKLSKVATKLKNIYETIKIKPNLWLGSVKSFFAK